MNTIAIDCGASFIKGALIEGETKEIVRRERSKAPKIQLEDPFSDTSQIESLISQVESLLDILVEGQNEVNFSISNEMHGFLLAEDDGTPLTDYISWQREYGNCVVDGERAADILSQEKYAECIYNSGMPLRGGLPSCNLLYLKRKKQLPTGRRIWFFTLGDYILYRIFGERMECHPTNAAATGLMDLTKNEWNERLLKAVSNENIMFPRIGDSKHRYKRKGCQYTVLPAIGDQQAALLGAGLYNLDELSFNLGTGAQVSTIIKADDLLDEINKIKGTRGIQIRPFFDGKYLKTMPHLPSGRALNVYMRFLKDIMDELDIDYSEEDLWKHFIEAALRCGKNSPLKSDLSFFENPITCSTKGMISEIGEYDLTLANMAGSIITQMTNNFLYAADYVCSNGKQIRKVFFSGGIASRFKQIRKNIADRYSEAEIFVAEDETLLGIERFFHYVGDVI